MFGLPQMHAVAALLEYVASPPGWASTTRSTNESGMTDTRKDDAKHIQCR